MQAAIEATARLKLSGWIGNAHLMSETTIGHLRQGYLLLKALCKATQLPLICMAVASHLIPQAQAEGWLCPILPIRRQLVPPWEKAQPFLALKD
jgi:hypothetical protein